MSLSGAEIPEVQRKVLQFFNEVANRPLECELELHHAIDAVGPGIIGGSLKVKCWGENLAWVAQKAIAEGYEVSAESRALHLSFSQPRKRN